MKKALLLMIVLVTTGMMVLLSCGNSGGVYGPSSSPGTMTMTGTFRVSGDSIYVTATTPADTMRYCMGDSLVVQIDSANTQQESGIPYSISNNTLTLTESFPDMSGAGYTIGLNINFSRVGSGIGVEGTWNLASITYVVLAGTAPDSIKHEVDSMNTAMNQMLASGEVSMQYTFSGTQFTAVQSYTYNWADYYVSSWTDCSYAYGADTCSYDVTVVKLNSSTVQMHGKTSGETVTITWNGAGDMTYTSSDPTHLAFTYYMNPVSCPNDYMPDWFATFLTANAKPGLGLPKKSAQQTTVPKKPPLTKWLRVF
jgi:hypothetical protein